MQSQIIWITYHLNAIGIDKISTSQLERQLYLNSLHPVVILLMPSNIHICRSQVFGKDVISGSKYQIQSEHLTGYAMKKKIISNWMEVFNVLQDSIVGPLLSDIFMYDTDDALESVKLEILDNYKIIYTAKFAKIIWIANIINNIMQAMVFSVTLLWKRRLDVM